MILYRLLLLSLLIISNPLLASDLAKEKRWSDQVVDSLIDGEAVMLNDGKSQFLGIFTEAEDNTERAVIVMHGTGVHPNWQQVVQPLRVGLTGHNWNTLSIQMPILANEAEYHEYAPLYSEIAPRIDAAIADLQQRGIKKIVLIGHSQGATMSAYYLRANPSRSADVKGFVAIGMSSWDNDARMNSIMSLQQITIPVLDLYGNEDLEPVLSTNEARAEAAKTAGNEAYKQQMITGNHFFDGQEEKLVATVAQWLETLP